MAVRGVGRAGALALSLAIIEGCGGGAVRTSPQAAASTSPVATPSAASAGAQSAGRCDDPIALVGMHGAPELEAMLPATLAGRTLTRWSLAGRCVLEAIVQDGSRIDSIIARADELDPRPLDLSHLRYAIAGRTDTTADPPWFVYAASRPLAADEIALSSLVLFGGGAFVDMSTADDLRTYQQATIAGKPVFVGDGAMLKQSEHQRGAPYLYQTDDAMFLVITEDRAWAEEAFAELP
jgi:hypothetical protein